MNIPIAIGRTGGGFALDGYPYSGLANNVFCLVQYTDSLIIDAFKYETANTDSESDPNTIIPNDNSTGSGAWVRTSFQNGISGAFSVAHFCYKLAAGTDYGSTADAWTTIALNTTVKNSMTDYCTIDGSGVITLKTASYIVNGWITAHGSTGVRAALYTGSAPLGRTSGIINLTAYGNSTYRGTLFPRVFGRLTIATDTDYTFRYFVDSAYSKFGYAANLDNIDEIFASLRIWRIG